MRSRPDYSVYHLHELKTALADIDEAANPEEAKIIREYIAKGGYTYPRVMGVRFISSAYKWALVAVIAVLFLTNLYSLVLGRTLIALVPLVVQGAILFVIFKKHKYARGLIMIWAALLIVSGSFGLFAMYYAPEISWPELAYHGLVLLAGALFFALANKCIELLHKSGSE